MGDLEHLSCDLCGRDDYRVLLPRCRALSGPLVRCRHCGLVYVNPRQVNYSVDEKTADPSGARVAVWDKYTQIWNASLISDSAESRHARANFESRVARIRAYTTSGSLLDIGCGKGHFLDVARGKGFAPVMGIEPNSVTASYACEHYGLEVAPILNYATFTDNSYDVVTMLHVLEHLLSPRRELQKVHRVLRPGGYLFIEVPNLDTIWFRLLRGRWRQLIPDHYTFYTPQTVRVLLESEGFQVYHISSVGKVMSLRFLLSRLWRYSQRLTLLSIRVAEKVRLADRQVHLNAGDVMWISASRI